MPDSNDGVPRVPDGADPGDGGDSPTGLHMDVQDTGDVFATGMVGSSSLVDAMGVMTEIITAYEDSNVPDSMKQEAWDLCTAFAREILDRSRAVWQ